MKSLFKLSIFVLASCLSTTLQAGTNPPKTAFDLLAGHWDMKCQASGIPGGVVGLAPKWYESTKEIFFVTPESARGSEVLYAKEIPSAIGSIALPLPVFYNRSMSISSHTYSDVSVSDGVIQNEFHVCDMEFDEFGRWGGAAPDVASALACTFQSWRNTEVKKTISLVDVDHAKIEITTHFRNPESQTQIECALSR